MESVMVALNDGLIGNKAVLIALSALTAGVFNFMRSEGGRGYEMQDILGQVHDYIFRPLTDAEKQAQANERLLTFMQLAPGGERLKK